MYIIRPFETFSGYEIYAPTNPLVVSSLTPSPELASGVAVELPAKPAAPAAPAWSARPEDCQWHGGARPLHIGSTTFFCFSGAYARHFPKDPVIGIHTWLCPVTRFRRSRLGAYFWPNGGGSFDRVMKYHTR